MTGVERIDRSPWFSVALPLICLAVIVWVPRMTSAPLRHWDEAWYAEVSRETLASDDWLTVRWNDAPWFHKPPLAFWATGLNYALWGVHEVSARLFSFLCGVVIVAVVGVAVSLKVGPATGQLAGLLLLAIPEFSRYATRGQLDVPIALFITLQLLCFWLGRSRPRWHLLAGVFLGMGIMTKGAAAGLAILVEMVYAAVARDAGFLRQRSWWGSMMLGIAIAIPWHAHQALTHGDAFLRDYFDRHLVQFVADIYPETDAPAAPAWYYVDFLVRKQSGWGWLFLAGWGLASWRLVRAPRDPFVLFLWCWASAIPVGLSIPWAKWSWYLVPMYPAAAGLIAWAVCDWVRTEKPLRWARAIAFLAVLGSAIEGITADPNKEYESDLRTIAPIVQREIPPHGQILTLQLASARDSVYPIATRFYGERNVRVVNGWNELDQVGTDAGNLVWVLMAERVWQEAVDRGRPTAESPGYLLEPIHVEGEVVFARLIPGWLAQQIRQAARNIDESR